MKNGNAIILFFICDIKNHRLTMKQNYLLGGER